MNMINSLDGGHVPFFIVQQKATLIINRYHIFTADHNGQRGENIAFAEQKRTKLKEEVLFFTDESKNLPLFSFKRRKALHPDFTTDVFDLAGNQIAWFIKNWTDTTSTWYLHYTGVEATGRETSQVKALIRNAFYDLPLPSPLTYDFDFIDNATDQPVMTVEHQKTLPDRYFVAVPDTRLDFRVAIAMVVALDAFEML
ncbi:MAG: hypothetical protein OXI96_04860 [Acidimicrobiaceae bacterium]|nr:hypothetical protein [Acidimicrobiaceae bacterium]